MSARTPSWLLLFGLLAGCESLIGLEERRLHPDAGARDAGDGAVVEDAGGQDPTDAGDAAAGDDLCDEYCTTVMANCRSTAAVYASAEECRAVCQALPPGDPEDPEDPDGNTVACRLREAREARNSDEPAFHCPEAGPGGAGTCGENCESYCLLVAEFCPDDQRPEGDECVRQCRALRDLTDETASSRFDAERDQAGDTLQCRLVHASQSALDPAGSCFKTQIKPRPADTTMEPNPCLGYPAETRPRCVDYCELVLGACTDELAVYENRSQCLAVCEELDLGLLTDDAPNDTIGCRKTHAYNALISDAETHCPHAGPGGAAVCGADCPAYCRLVRSACEAAFEAEFGAGDDGATACESQCDELRGPGHLRYSIAAAESGSDALACRMLHAARAVSSPGADSVCESALGRGACE